jgi:cytochrome d ubiquinol oxidase subunit I
MDALDLARAQFGFTVAVHIIFPVFSIGLASYLAVLETLWLKIFAIGFAAGVVSGLVMSYQFGTNWSVFSDKAGPVIGPLLAYEVLSAFFLEAGFLGVMLFGLERVGKKLHYLATLAVAAGTFMSAFWILSANSWMQTPTGYSINDVGQFIPVDWMAVIFNPSFPYRLVHMVLAAYLTTALTVGAVGAFHLLRDGANPASRIMFSMAMGMIAVVAPLQIFAGDLHGLNTLKYQPAKILAIEGHYQAHPEGAPLILFGLPNQAEARVDDALEIPHLSSVILKHDPNAPMQGLEDFPREDWPPVPIVFWSFRLMAGLGFAMLGLGAAALFARIRGTLYESPWLFRYALAMGPAGFVAVVSGWVTTEVGRQPFTVFGLLRTDHSVSPLASPAVATSLAAFAVIYFAVFSAGLFYILRLMGHAPHPGESGPADMGPLSIASQTPIIEEVS